MANNETDEHMELMKECYFRLYGSYKEYNELKKSVYPYQGNDYYMLTIPEKFIKRNVACDAILKNLVKYIWGQDIETQGWHSPNKESLGFISIDEKTLNDKNTLELVKKMFGEKNMMIHDHCTQGPEPGKEIRRWQKMLKEKYPNKIHYEINPWYHGILFTEEMLIWMHKKLGISIPDVSKSLAGYRRCKKLMNKN